MLLLKNDDEFLNGTYLKNINILFIVLKIHSYSLKVTVKSYILKTWITLYYTLLQ